MSKMSQLHAELSEQAYDMGYVSLEEAIANGWDVDYENAKLIKKMSYSDTVEWLRKEEEKAHKAWLEEKKEILGRLKNLYNELVYIKTDEFNMEYLETVRDAIEFIKRGEV